MGLSVSDAVCVSSSRVAAEQQLPVEIRVPNAPTRAAMDEAWTMSRARFKRARERLRDFQEDSGR
jgi:DNA-damage-inducible protein J